MKLMVSAQLIWIACVCVGLSVGYSAKFSNGSNSRQLYSRTSPSSYNLPIPAAKSCEGPIPPVYGSVACKITSLRYICRGSCYAGYIFADGKDFYELECTQETGVWAPNQKVPDCKEVGRGMCGQPKSPINGRRQCKMSNGLWSCIGMCNMGFEFPDGSRRAVSTCNDKYGRWSPKKDFEHCRRTSPPVQGKIPSQQGILQPVIRGKVSSEQETTQSSLLSGRNTRCDLPKSPMNGGRQCTLSTGEWTCIGTCIHGHKFPNGAGRAIYKCNNRDGHWSPKKEFDDCTPDRRETKRCVAPKSPMNGVKQCSITNGQWVCRGTCLPGFKFPDGSNQANVTCKVGEGQWSPRKDFDDCTHPLCVSPKPATHGRVKCQRRGGVKICIGACMPGYRFKDGSSELTIQCSKRTGEWTPSASFLECEPVCSPECQNGGKCVRPNSCLCPRDYSGSKCEHRQSLINSIYQNNGGRNGKPERYTWQQAEYLSPFGRGDPEKQKSGDVRRADATSVVKAPDVRGQMQRGSSRDVPQKMKSYISAPQRSDFDLGGSTYRKYHSGSLQQNQRGLGKQQQMGHGSGSLQQGRGDGGQQGIGGQHQGRRLGHQDVGYEIVGHQQTARGSGNQRPLGPGVGGQESLGEMFGGQQQHRSG